MSKRKEKVKIKAGAAAPSDWIELASTANLDGVFVRGSSLYQEEPSESPLFRASDLVHGERGADYGHPYEDFSRTALMWSAILGINVVPADVAMCMIAVKLSREVNRPKYDNLVDIAGYAETLHMVREYEREQAEASAGDPPF